MPAACTGPAATSSHPVASRARAVFDPLGTAPLSSGFASVQAQATLYGGNAVLSTI